MRKIIETDKNGIFVGDKVVEGNYKLKSNELDPIKVGNPEGFYLPCWSGNTWTEYRNEGFILELLKPQKINELNNKCQNTIYSGFVSQVNGHKYSWKEHDQINLLEMNQNIRENPSINEVEWGSDDAGATILDIPQFQSLISEFKLFKIKLINRFRKFVDKIKSATSKGEIHSLDWSDTIPPNPPIGLSGSALISGCALTWSGNSEFDLDGYNVYQTSGNVTGNSIFNQINDEIVSGNSYVASELVVGDTYEFEVTAVDICGNESNRSNTITIKI